MPKTILLQSPFTRIFFDRNQNFTFDFTENFYFYKIACFCRQLNFDLTKNITFFQELLPKIPGEENDQFRAETLYLLFQGENMKFGNPFEMFKNKLTSGKMSQRHLKKKEIIKKYRRKKRQITVVSQCFANLSELSSNHSKPHPSISHEVKRLSRHAAKKMKSLNVDERVGKRQITELRRIRLEVQEKGDSSDDEDFIQELLSERDRKTQQLKSLQNWHQNTPKSAAAKNHSSNTGKIKIDRRFF